MVDSDHPGWKTQFMISVTDNSTFVHDKEIFYGLGNCPPTEPDQKELNKVNSNKGVIEYYTRVLRTDCISSRKEKIQELLKSGLVKLKNKMFQIVPKHELL